MLEIVGVMRKASGKTLEVEFCEKRAGDIGVCYADIAKAEKELHWKSSFGIERMCADAWRWHSSHPNDYAG